MVKQRRGGNRTGYGTVRYQNQVMYVHDIIEDENYGIGLVASNIATGVCSVVFQHPIPSEARRNAPRVNSISDWVNGVKIGKANTFTVTPGSYVYVGDISFKFQLPPFSVVVEGEEMEVNAMFVQWTSSWLAEEQKNDDPQKDIFMAYAIGRSFPPREYDGRSVPESLDFNIFYPVGENNPFNVDGELYPVVFRFDNLDDVRKHVAHEAEIYGRPFRYYMVRMVDKKTNEIVGCGEFVSCNMYNYVNAKIEDIFTQNLAKRLGYLTYTGLESLLSEEDYAFEMYGLCNMSPSIQKGERKTSLRDEILSNINFIPRDENGEQCEIFAQPVAIRGQVYNENFWIDKCVGIGKTGWDQTLRSYGSDSDIIPADSYIGTPLDENYNIAERGLNRFEPVFIDENDEEVPVFSLRELAKMLGCKSVRMPNGGDSDFDLYWDDRPTEEEPKVENAKEVTKKAPVKAVSQTTQKQTGTQVAKPAARATSKAVVRHKPKEQHDELGPVFPSEATGMDDVPF